MSNPTPEVRQCADPDDPQFGSVAVRTTHPGPWGVMSPANGGHHTTDDEVKDWPAMIAAAPADAPSK